MKKYTIRPAFFPILALILLMLFSACSKEIWEDDRNPIYEGERLPISLRLKDGGTTEGDDRIASVRVIVFHQGQLVSNKLTEITSSTQVTVTTEVARGANNFYIICNENKELSGKLADLTQESLVEGTTFQAAGITPPIPMYGNVMDGMVSANRDGSNVQVMVNGVTSTILSTTVNRLMAKINFTAIKNIANGDEDFNVEELKIRVCHMPIYTPLKEEQPYTGKKWADNISLSGEGQLSSNGTYEINIVDGKKVYTIPEGVDKITFPDIYIPEHLLEVAADRSKCTYLTVDATCRMKNGNTQVLHSTYQVCLGENPPASFNLKRNNQYKIYATITGMGAMGIYAEILAMDQFDIPINWKPIDGLVIVSDKLSDYDFTAGQSKNVNVWNDYTVYSGILKVYHSEKGYNNVLFKYGSLIAVNNDEKTGSAMPFVSPPSESDLGDILWYPSSFGNPFGKINAWNDIPYISSGNIPAENSDPAVAQGSGDPCKLVGLSAEQIRDEKIVDNKQWHMATPEEYAILTQAADNESNDYGYKAFHYIMAPDVKTRDTDGLLATSHSGAGNYWTTKSVQAFGFTSATPDAAGVKAEDARNGYTIRCVRNVIPASTLAVTSMPSFSYQGNTTTGISFPILSNIPYWTAKLIDDSKDSYIGTATEFDDFSFAPGETNVRSVAGSFSQSIPVYVKRKENTAGRTFRIRVTGMGFDGRHETVIVTVTQNGYSLTGIPSFTPTIDDTNWIPKAGRAYDLTIKITPTDIAVPAGNLVVICTYLGSEISRSDTEATTPAQYVYTGTSITIPENKTPDPIGLEFKVYLLDNPTYGPSREIGTIYRMQNNK